MHCSSAASFSKATSAEGALVVIQVHPPTERGITLWGIGFAIVFLWSAIAPFDRFTWWLEIAPALIAAGVLAFTRTRFPLTPLVYVLVLLHAWVLMIGGHYTYAKVPAFDWLRDALELSRNHYDRVGHFFQGFVPAMVARELLLRCTPLGRSGWLVTIVISFCLAVSASYELLEWGVAVATGEAADAFLGTQGDPWDKQTDMFMCLIGAVTALLTLSGVHDRALSDSRD